MKCAVVAVLCGLAAAVAVPTFRSRHGRQPDDGNYYRHEGASYETVYDKAYSDSYDYSQSSTAAPVPYDNVYQSPTYTNGLEQPNVADLNNNLPYEPHKYQDNYVQYAPLPQGPVPHYHPDVRTAPYPTQSTPVRYGPPLAPHPVQYNQYQNGQPVAPNYNGYNDLFGTMYAPPAVAVTPSKPTTTKATTTTTKATTTTQPPPPPQPPNNILSLLFSLSQSSSSLSLPKTTQRPAPATTAATAQPPPKAQVYSFANVPPPFQSPQLYYPPQRRVFTQLFG